MRETVAVGVGVALLLVGGLAGCATSSSCRDYVALDTPEARAADASLVVDARVTATDRTADVDGVYRLHRAVVTDVRKGDAPSHALEVFAPSDQCTTGGQAVEYSDGDPLDEPGDYRLYLHEERAGLWRLIVPDAAERLD
ncbi:hypothetical protein ACRQ4B_17350 [Curtobacterium sp. SP.BCo]|uniref:hypothetical protein n=1 Tax=Curtobacterium sp. SP.BCo TaxID=3435229 RepID=UPI003F7367B8